MVFQMGDDNPPTLGEHIHARLWEKLGVRGLVLLAALSAAFYLWSNWDDVKTWPGVASAIEYVTRDDLPTADSQRFSVAVALLQDDTNGEYRTLITRLLGDFKGVQVLSLDRMIFPNEADPEKQASIGHATAREYLETTRASVLIWGRVLRLGSRSNLDLFMTTANQDGGATQYSLECEQNLRLPDVFWDELSGVIRLIIATRGAEFSANNGRYVAGNLRPYINRVRTFVDAGTSGPGWDADARGSVRKILADALTTLGDQSGDSVALHEGLVAYRLALEERTRDRVPLDWAGTQNNLGIALATLGERESGTARLEEAIAAYGIALEVFEAAEASYYIAVVRENLLRSMGFLQARINE